MLKILRSYARMKVISVEEVHMAMDRFGITIFQEAILDDDADSEIVFKMIFSNKNDFFQDGASSEEFCKTIETEICKSLKSSTVLKWIQRQLGEDEDIDSFKKY